MNLLLSTVEWCSILPTLKGGQQRLRSKAQALKELQKALDLRQEIKIGKV